MNVHAFTKAGCLLGLCGLAASWSTMSAHAQVTTYGALSNFDCPNESDDDCDEFDIELHGPRPEDVYHTYANPNYGTPEVTAVTGGTLIRYRKPKHATLPGSIEHFGVSLANFNANPTPTFTWMAGGQPAHTNSNPLQPTIVVTPTYNGNSDPILTEEITNNDPWNRRMWVKRSVVNVTYAVTLEELMVNDPLVQGSEDVDLSPVLLWPGDTVTFDQLEVGDGVASAVINYDVYRDLLLFGQHTPGSLSSTVMNAVVLNTAVCGEGPLQMAQQPVGGLVLSGGEIELQVDVIDNSESGTLAFQWFHEGAEVSGATSDSLVLKNIVPADGGAYYCVATGMCGMIVSEVARVDVVVCAADYNKDGFVDVYDFTEFVSDFEDGSPRADFNNDLFQDIYDFTDFVTAFEKGC